MRHLTKIVRPLQHLLAPILTDLRLTQEAKIALDLAGNRITDGPSTLDSTQDVELVRPPQGLVAVNVIGSPYTHVRLVDERPRRGEYAASWWIRGQWLPCPECGYALLWCESGFAPGWRVCLAGHACQLSDDGSTVERRPDRDQSAVRAMRPIV